MTCCPIQVAEIHVAKNQLVTFPILPQGDEFLPSGELQVLISGVSVGDVGPLPVDTGHSPRLELDTKSLNFRIDWEERILKFVLNKTRYSDVLSSRAITFDEMIAFQGDRIKLLGVNFSDEEEQRSISGQNNFKVGLYC